MDLSGIYLKSKYNISSKNVGVLYKMYTKTESTAAIKVKMS